MANPEPSQAQSPNPRKYLRIKEAAWELGVGYSWLFRRIGTPEGPEAVKRGKMWLLDRQAFDQWASRSKID